jgi:hypothetical protein
MYWKSTDKEKLFAIVMLGYGFGNAIVVLKLFEEGDDIF